MQVKSLDSRASAIVFIEVVICLVINITSLVGNILVCLSVYRNSRLRTSINLYIIGLAIADLLSAVIVMPFTTIVLISGDWIIGPFLCDLHAFVMNFVLFVSPTTMALTAFNRYIRIVKPGKYMTVFSKRRSVMMLGSAWAFVAFYVAIPKLSGLQDYGFVPDSSEWQWLSRTLYCSNYFVFDNAIYCCNRMLLQGLRSDSPTQPRYCSRPPIEKVAVSHYNTWDKNQ